MSTDYSLVCMRCRKSIHVGQVSLGNGFVSAHGSDNLNGRLCVAQFIGIHEPHQTTEEPLIFKFSQAVHDTEFDDIDYD